MYPPCTIEMTRYINYNRTNIFSRSVVNRKVDYIVLTTMISIIFLLLKMC